MNSAMIAVSTRCQVGVDSGLAGVLPSLSHQYTSTWAWLRFGRYRLTEAKQVDAGNLGQLTLRRGLLMRLRLWDLLAAVVQDLQVGPGERHAEAGWVVEVGAVRKPEGLYCTSAA